MNKTTIRIAIFLSVLLAVAGCLGAPTSRSHEQDRPVELVFDNSANTTQTFEVWVVEFGSNVSYEKNYTETRHRTIGEGLSTQSAGDTGYYTIIEPPESARFHGNFTVEPGQEAQSSVDNFRTDYAVLVILHQGDTIGWWATANCGGLQLEGVDVHTRASEWGDAWAGYGCE